MADFAKLFVARLVDVLRAFGWVIAVLQFAARILAALLDELRKPADLP